MYIKPEDQFPHEDDQDSYEKDQDPCDQSDPRWISILGEEHNTNEEDDEERGNGYDDTSDSEDEY